MLTIHLNHLKFHAFHGLYADEKVLGNAFEVNAAISYQPEALPVKDINQTIDYAAVYELIRDQMNVPVLLLEEFVTATSLLLLQKFPIAEQVSLSVTKLQTPISGLEGNASVSFKLTRQEIIR